MKKAIQYIFLVLLFLIIATVFHFGMNSLFIKVFGAVSEGVLSMLGVVSLAMSYFLLKGVEQVVKEV